MAYRNHKKILKITRNKKKKQSKIVLLARSKLNSIETLISQALIDLEMNYEEHKSIINEEKNYRSLKENVSMMKSDAEKEKLKKKEDKKI